MGCVSMMPVLMASVATAQTTVFDVTKYGAKADGISDMSQALLNAWKDACAMTTPSRVYVPGGTYKLGVVDLHGPCKAPIEVHVKGNILAPVQISGDKWVSFSYIDRFKLSGTGTFNGQGQVAWAQKNNCRKNFNCKMLAVNMRFNYITNGHVRGISSIDSKNFHVVVLGCNNFTIRSFTASAPRHSINTDGIHIGRSARVKIIDTRIETGDDCISIGDASKRVRITRAKCGPGHGISIGSLGRYANESPVSGIFVKNCTLKNTDNGVRIKSWPSMHNGLATDIHFEDIIMDNVTNPVIIDQVYCPWNQCNRNVPSKVKISNMRFSRIQGTSASPVAISINCSSLYPCQNVLLSDIDLRYISSSGNLTTTTQCANVKPIFSGFIYPTICKWEWIEHGVKESIPYGLE